MQRDIRLRVINIMKYNIVLQIIVLYQIFQNIKILEVANMCGVKYELNTNKGHKLLDSKGNIKSFDDFNFIKYFSEDIFVETDKIVSNYQELNKIDEFFQSLSNNEFKDVLKRNGFRNLRSSKEFGYVLKLDAEKDFQTEKILEQKLNLENQLNKEKDFGIDNEMLGAA